MSEMIEADGLDGDDSRKSEKRDTADSSSLNSPGSLKDENDVVLLDAGQPEALEALTEITASISMSSSSKGIVEEKNTEKEPLPQSYDQCCGGPTHDCNKLANHECGSCLTTRYCCRPCQKEHWPKHKKECKIWRNVIDLSGNQLAQKLTILMLGQKFEEASIILELFRYEHHRVRKLDGLFAYRDQGGSLLHHAAERGDLDFAERLIELGAEVDVQASDGSTPLIIAAQKNHLDVLDLYLRHGADPDLSFHNGCTALAIAGQFGHFEVIRRLCEAGASHLLPNAISVTANAALHGAAAFGHRDVVAHLLEHGVHPDTPRGDGGTALMLACKTNQREIVRLLLASGATVDLQDRFGITALMAASHHGFPHIMKALLEAGADVSIVNKSEESALDAARESRQIECVRMLEKAGRHR